MADFIELLLLVMLLALCVGVAIFGVGFLCKIGIIQQCAIPITVLLM